MSERTFWCACGWKGITPSYTDASEEKEDRNTGVTYVDRRHIAICPECYSNVIPDTRTSQRR